MARSRNIRVKMEPPKEKFLPEALRNLQGVYVWVSHLAPDVEGLGLSREQLRREVTQRLSLAGITVLNSRDLLTTPLFPCLGILLHVDRGPGEPPHHLYSLEVFFVKAANLLADQSANSLNMVWCREAIGDVRQNQARETDWTALFGSLGELVGLFIDDYLEVNSGGPGLLN
ncbi:MAG: hypothetical protein FJ128_12865 [Deltaproteobacteria bacterium]|nr:hypothetical protein [Deltaproteobacteria bacterium]MBM4286116.1 hypothetical protein [Deltaproteobacteria bacterium]